MSTALNILAAALISPDEPAIVIGEDGLIYANTDLEDYLDSVAVEAMWSNSIAIDWDDNALLIWA